MPASAILPAVSQQNVELVRAVQPRPEVDLASMFREEASWRATREVLVSLLHPDFECSIPLFGDAKSFSGIDGLRAAWLDWLEPWATYRTEVDELIDRGERVLVLVRDYGRHEPHGNEVEQIDAAIWTVREGKIARAEFYTDRGEAFREAGIQQ
jgi:ketosteroid isomerase-like protein